MDNGCPGTRSLFNRFYGTNVRRKEDPKGLVAVAQEMDTKTKTLSARCWKVLNSVLQATGVDIRKWCYVMCPETCYKLTLECPILDRSFLKWNSHSNWNQVSVPGTMTRQAKRVLWVTGLDNTPRYDMILKKSSWQKEDLSVVTGLKIIQQKSDKEPSPNKKRLQTS